MNIYPALRNSLFQLEAERAHLLTMSGLSAAASVVPPNLYNATREKYRHLNTVAGGVKLAHPLGLAAGFDKNGYHLQALQGLGFSHVEVGTVTPLPTGWKPKAPPCSASLLTKPSSTGWALIT